MMGREKRHVWPAIKSFAVIHKSLQNARRERPRRGVFVCGGVMEGRSKNASLVDLHSGMILVGRADSSFRMCMHYADACAFVFARCVCVQC